MLRMHCSLSCNTTTLYELTSTMAAKYTAGFLERFNAFFESENSMLYNKYHNNIFFPEGTDTSLKYFGLKECNPEEWEEVVIIWKNYIMIR
jgi:hypothetical protein